MFKIIDTDLRSFAIAYGTQMTRDLQPALVCFLYCRPKLVPRDIHIRLKGRRTLIGPEVHHPTRIVRPRQLVHHRSERTLALEIRCRNIHLRSDHLATIDTAFSFEIGVRRDTSRGSYRGHTERQVQPRKAD